MNSHGEILINGVRFKSINRDYTGTVTLKIFVRGGIFRENPETNGVGSLAARVWTKSSSLLEKIEFLGGYLSADISNDYLEFSLSVPSEYLPDLIADLEEHLLSPVFNTEVFEIEKELALREIEAEKDDPNGMAFKAFTQATYGQHPYSLDIAGTTSTVLKLTLENIKEYHTANFTGADMVAVLAGNFSANDEQEVKKILSRIKAGTHLDITCLTSNISNDSKSQTIDERIQQAKLFVAYTAPAAGDKNYVKTKVLSEYLGGGMSSPYFNALRKEKGYAYAVSSMYPSRLCASRFIGYIGLAPENAETAEKIMRSINIKASNAVIAEDLAKVKNHIIGQILSGAETNSRLAWYAAFFETLGLGFEYMDKYIEEIRSITVQDVTDAATIFQDTPSTTFLYTFKTVKEYN